MKLNKEKKEIEAFFEREEIVLGSPTALLKQLEPQRKIPSERIVASIYDCLTTTWLGSSGSQLPRVSPTSH